MDGTKVIPVSPVVSGSIPLQATQAIVITNAIQLAFATLDGFIHTQALTEAASAGGRTGWT
jgi:hypothetical protein